MKKSSNKNLSPEKIFQANHESKGLIEFGGRPFLSYLLDNILKVGFKIVYIITGENSKIFRKTFENNPNFNQLKIKFATQYIYEKRDKPYGTADALYQCLEQYPNLKTDKFCVCNSDNLYSKRHLKCLEILKQSQAILAYDIDYLKYPRERISKFAVMRFNKFYDLLAIIEKPQLEKIAYYRDDTRK